MKKIVKALIILLAINFLKVNPTYGISNNDDVKIDLLTIMISYDEIENLEEVNGKIYFVLNNGQKILYDDSKTRTVEQCAGSENIKDILNQDYPLESIEEVMPKNCDPGRGRNYNLLEGIYGKGEKNIYNNLKYIDTKAGTVLFTHKNKGDIAIKNALDKCVELAKENKSINRFIYNRGGTFNYRVVQDTGKLSPHSFGIAIDLCKDDRDYWKWVDSSKGAERIREYPVEMVKAFEENGFIWGGKWNHFDSLHFEYRPEIILKAKVKAKISRDSAKEWFSYFEENDNINGYVEIIEKLNLN